MEVRLNSLGTYVLPSPSLDKMLKYLTLGRGIFSFECNSSSTVPIYKSQHTDLYDVAPLAQNLPDVDALHELVPKLCQYDYSSLRNSTMNCVGYIQTQNDGTTIDLFGFNEPPFSLQVKAAVPDPADPVANAYWAQSVSSDKQWQVYRVHTSGGQIPTSCQGHENSNLDVLYAAEYWFYHK